MRFLPLLLLVGAFAPQEKRPNVVLVLCDDLGYGDLGSFGHPVIKSPHLDQFAKDGLKLTDCHAAAPLCSPSRSALLTGRTPYRSGVTTWIPAGSPMHLQKSEITLARLLKEQGYATCHVGKWHCNGKFNSPEQPQPGDHGFDHWMSTQNNAAPSHQKPSNFVRNGKPAGPQEGYSATVIVNEATRWLKEEWKRDQPFFLCVWFHNPHEPIATADEFMKPYEGDKAAVYYGNVSQADHEFGRLMGTLDELKLRDGTFVMFTSDNGPEPHARYKGAERSFGSSGPVRGKKLSLYEGGYRVPGIIRWPGRVAPGSVSDAPVNGTDFLPTVCAITGAKVPADRPVDGVSLLPLFEGKPLERKVPLYWRFDKSPDRMKVAMRDGEWKLLATADLSAFELYNLKSDLAEATDLSAKEPERLKAMSERLKKLDAEIDAERPRWPGLDR